MPSNNLLFGKSATYNGFRFSLDRLSPAHCRDGIDLVEHDAGFTHLASCFDAQFLADRFGQILDDMRLVSEFFRVQRGFLHAMLFRQSDDVHARDASRLQRIGKRLARRQIRVDLRSCGNAVGVVFRSFEAGV